MSFKTLDFQHVSLLQPCVTVSFRQCASE
uniref:Uncharacterized protein n=1 Tax=Anguilla anguilla TaxID=7936 RepID=A0A0E9SH62_ANGAN